MYALVDCNNFYASCERVFKPWLNKIPIVVLSNNDGCVIARSQEVKDLGVKMGAPAFKHKDVFEKHNVKVFSSNYTLYGDMSHRVMNILSSFTPDIEIYSIYYFHLNVMVKTRKRSLFFIILFFEFTHMINYILIDYINY